MDWLAAILEVCGIYITGNKNRWGFLLCAACNLLWISVALRTGIYGLAIVCVAMFGVNCVNFRKWSKA